MRKRLLSFVLAVLMIATLLPVTALAYTTYYINGVAVRCDDFDSSPNECWTYANNIYNKIWGQQFNSLFDDSANSLRNLSDSELTLTAEHLRNYVSNAALGSALRICSSEYLHGGDGWGHSQIIVQKDSNGFTVLQGGLSASPYRNERYYTWSEYLNSWNYAYIKYIKWPGAPAYGGGTVTPDPDPGLSVKETITCKRTIKLPERVVNLYSNPTDTTRLTYFDYGPTVYSSRYAVMSDGSIMYEVGANHQGQDIKAWLKYESDMTVTKEHTYGSTQYESAHPHRGYKTCQCGDKFYTGETTARSDCSECNANVKYAVDGGYITFDRKTGTITDCDSMVTKANIPQKIEGVAVKSIGANAFNNQQHLESVTIPDGVTSIGERAFCSSGVLTSVKIPDSVTSIGAYAFDTCSSLTNVTIPNGVTSIEEHTFDSCISLTSVTIPDSVTSIGDWAFSHCTSLTSVTIPDSVTSINWYAFYNCKSLTDVYYAGSEAQWKAISISSTGNDDLLTANIHYNYVSHTHSYKDVVTAPTCTAKGYTTHTCACGDSYVDTYVDALGHAWDAGKVTEAPTETKTGVKTFTCTRCGETKTETIPATGSDVDVTEMFSDVTKNWAYPGIQYCVTHKLMGSTGGDKFAPTMTTTRAQIVQILYNLEGEPEVSGTTPFTDLTQDWYQDAVLWAHQTGVVAGTGDGTTFDPDLPVTREQIAVILMEYTDRILNIKRTWAPADLSGFPDAGSVSDWAKDAMADAVALGLISGASNGGQTLLEPQGSATREQVATILMEFCKNVKK